MKQFAMQSASESAKKSPRPRRVVLPELHLDLDKHDFAASLIEPRIR